MENTFIKEFEYNICNYFIKLPNNLQNVDQFILNIKKLKNTKMFITSLSRDGFKVETKIYSNEEFDYLN